MGIKQSGVFGPALSTVRTGLAAAHLGHDDKFGKRGGWLDIGKDNPQLAAKGRQLLTVTLHGLGSLTFGRAGNECDHTLTAGQILKPGKIGNKEISPE